MSEDVKIYDWGQITAKLSKLVRVTTPPIGLKRFATEEEMRQVPKIRVPKPEERFLMCQMVGQAARLNYTVGFTKDSILSPICRAVIGFDEKGEDFYSGKWRDMFHGNWHIDIEDAGKHQQAMYTAEYGNCAAVAIAPLESGRLNPPDICLIYMTPGQMIYFVNALQVTDYEVIVATVVGESSCSDTIGKSLKTGKPSVSLPCFAERRYGCTLDNEMLISLTPDDLVKAIEGMEHLSKQGIRYPAPFYGVNRDAREGMSVSFPWMAES